MRRFGKDIEEAARRIRGLMTRQEVAKARSARVSAEADKLRAGGWRPYVGTVEQGPTLADAQAAIEAGFERDAAIEAEAAHRLGNRDTQLTQVDTRDQALPLPPALPAERAATVGEFPADPLAGWPETRSPLGSAFVRLRDGYARDGGIYAGNRTHNGKNLPHAGIDLATAASTAVYSPIDGEITHIGWACKNGDFGLRSIHVTGPDGHKVKVLYVKPTDDLKIGSSVTRDSLLGQSQSLQTKFPPLSNGAPMTDHVHFEFSDPDGTRIDPTPWVDRWREEVDNWWRLGGRNGIFAP